MRNAVGSKTSLVFARNAFALQKIDRSLNSSLDSSWFLVLFPSYLGGGGGWLNVVKIYITEKNFRARRVGG